MRFDVIIGKALRRAACPHAADCSKFRLDETLWSSTIIYRRCKSQYIRRSHFFGKDNRIVLVKQYRKAIEKVSYEIPAGKLEAGEAQHEQEAAARELEEETGYSGQLTKIYDFYTATGFCNEKIRLYLGTDLQKVPNPRPQDDDEVLEILELTYAECMDLVASGAIEDAKTIIALQYYALTFGGNL